MKIVKKLCAVAGTLGIIGILAINAYPIITGGKLYQIKTGSMEPTIPAGSYVLVRPVTDPQVGEVILIDAPGYTSPVVHRIVAVDAAGKTLTTRGDANGVDDAAIDHSQVMGIVTDIFKQKGVYHRPYQFGVGIFSLVLIWLSLTKTSLKGRKDA